MNNLHRLSSLRCGETASVAVVDGRKEMKERLRDLGMIEGTTIKCIHKSPLGDPRAYLIRGAVIAIRNEDADCVQISL